jgi:hypothetical protein
MDVFYHYDIFQATEYVQPNPISGVLAAPIR